MVAKISQRKEARTAGGKKTVVTIPYAVFNIEEFERRCESPRVKDKGGYQKALASFHNKYMARKLPILIVERNCRPSFLKILLDNPQVNMIK